jgi:peptidyl-prolyl cis-trans isomerase SurA
MMLDGDGHTVERRSGTRMPVVLKTAALVAVFAWGSLAAGTRAAAQIVKAPRYEGTAPIEAPAPQLNMPPLPAAKTPHGTVVEDVVARVNDQIISRSDVERSAQQLQQEMASQNAPPAEVATRERDMLRDMIDQQLLLSKAKELGLNADAEVVRQLDEIRKQNKLDSMEDLEKAARQQGVSFEDFKAQIRDQILTRQVVRDEVGRRLQVTQADEAKYYNAHKNEFEQPEQVRLSEILVPLPENATPAEIVQAERKANELKSEIMKGADFAEVAKKSSGGPTAAQGGELGLFKRGALAKVLEDQTFDLKPGESTQPIRTRQGFVILKVTGHQQAGPAPLKDVEPQVQEAMYMAQMQPALRAYLTKLREESYVDIQPGFVDSGASPKETKPVFTAYAPPAVKLKKAKDKSRFDRNGRYVTASATKSVVASPDTTGTRTITGPEAAPLIDPKTGLAVLPATRTASGKKIKGVKREKVRFGQAPRNALPEATEQASSTAAGTGAVSGASAPAASSGTASGVALASASGGADAASLDSNPLDPVAPPKTKTRFAARAVEHKEKKAATLTAKQKEKIAATPTPMSSDEVAATQTQAAPLGLSGDTAPKKKTKPKKLKRQRGQPKPPKAPKTRMEDQKKVAPPAPAQIAPTANPSLAPTSDTGTGRGTAPPAPSPVPNSTGPAPVPSQPDTTVPPVTPPAPGAPQTPHSN